MTHYNGFTPAERNAAQAWLNREWTAGRLARPSVCLACGQDQGVIDAHAEDYSRPFTAAKLMAFPLCLICHLMLHCRFGSGRAAWDAYRRLTRLGCRYEPARTRNFGIVQAMLAGRPRSFEVLDEAPTRFVLDEIHEGLHVPKTVAPRDLFTA